MFSVRLLWSVTRGDAIIENYCAEPSCQCPEVLWSQDKVRMDSGGVVKGAACVRTPGQDL